MAEEVELMARVEHQHLALAVCQNCGKVWEQQSVRIWEKRGAFYSTLMALESTVLQADSHLDGIEWYDGIATGHRNCHTIEFTFDVVILVNRQVGYTRSFFDQLAAPPEELVWPYEIGEEPELRWKIQPVPE